MNEPKETISLKYKYQNISIFREAESELDVEVFERRLLVVPLARADDEMHHLLHRTADVRAQLETLVLLVVRVHESRLRVVGEVFCFLQNQKLRDVFLHGSYFLSKAIAHSRALWQDTCLQVSSNKMCETEPQRPGVGEADVAVEVAPDSGRRAIAGMAVVRPL